MKILSDRHHSGLAKSLIMLFQKRLGYELYFQKGMEWYPEFWALQPFKETAVQYLERELEGLPGVTLEEFKNTKFDALLCSVPQHVPMWIKLRDLYQPQAKLIFQVGNTWAFDNSFPIKNILASAAIPNLPGFNTVTYHEEFDLSIFKPQDPTTNKKIYSFINCLNVVDIYKKDWELFLDLEKLMPDWEFKSFGGQCRDGWFNGPQEVADKMKEATFIFNCKTNGDGYGFTLHEAAAMGRPIITRFSDYKDKLAEPLLTSFTSVLVDNRTPSQIAEQLEALVYFTQNKDIINSPLNVESMGIAISKAFTENVDFDKEEVLIRDFLSKLV